MVVPDTVVTVGVDLAADAVGAPRAEDVEMADTDLETTAGVEVAGVLGVVTEGDAVVEVEDADSVQ